MKKKVLATITLKKRPFLLFIVLFIFILPGVLASLGISPAKVSQNFQPGLQFSVVYTVNAQEGQRINISADGDLAEYVDFNTNEITGSGNFVATVRLPQEIELPGLHRLYIMASQIIEAGGGVGTSINVGAVIAIAVPFPGQYLVLNDFNVNDINIGELLPVSFSVSNLGKENITAEARAEISNSITSERMGTYSLGSQEIPVESIRGFSEIINTSGYSPGSYIADGYIIYPGKIINASRFFRIGSLFVNITNYTKEFKAGIINHYDIWVRSQWNSDIDNVYGKLTVFSPEGNITSTTPSVELKRWEETKLDGFFDATLLQPGRYNAEIDIFYMNTNTTKFVEIVSYTGFFTPANIVILAAVILVVAAIIIVVIWIIRRRIRGRHGKEKEKTGKK